MKYETMVNNLGSKVMKKVNKVVEFAQTAEFNITQKDVVERIYNVMDSQGLETALNALESTMKNMKEKAKVKENEMWNKVKAELMKKGSSVPTSTNHLKSMIKNGEIDFSGIDSQKWIESQLGIYQTV